jgi:hypothetical protein
MKTTILITILAAAVPAAAGETDPPQLVDVTEKAGITFSHSIGDDELSNIVESTGAGCAFFDYDNDGDLDIYLVNGSYLKEISHLRGRKLAGKLKNQLFRNNGNGTFSDVTDAAGVGDQGFGMACVSADYDNDGDADLYVTNYGRNVLYRNQGDGTFSDVAEQAGVADARWSVGATFFDLDNDGHLDLYVGNYLVYDPDYKFYFAAEAFPGPLAYQGVPDALFRNRGDGTFEEISARAGIANPQGRAMGVAAADYDNDGDLDVYVANDGMENYFYENQGNQTFKNVALFTNTGFGQNGEATSAMGPEFGDFNRDGLIDVMVPDMGYGCLYANTGKGYFEEKSARLGVAAVLGQYTSWSGNFFDFDNDGDLDIFITNGDSHHLEPEEDTLFRNDQGTGFVDISAKLGPDLQQKFVGRGSAAGDYDNDGDLDLLVLNLNARARLLRNDGGNRGSWLMIDATGSDSNRDAIGTRIRVTAGGVTQTAEVRSASGYLSQSDSRVHFGLGSHKQAGKVEIRWPNGEVQVLKNVPANQVLVLTEPGATAKKKG